MKKLSQLSIPFFLLPTLVFASPATVKDAVALIIGLLANVMSLLYVAAFASLFYGVAMFVMNTSDAGKRDKAKGWITWSVIGLFVMLCLWAIVGIFTSTFGFTNVIPQLPIK